MDDIIALMGGVNTPKEQQMANALRGKQNTGNFFAMSTLDPVAKMGANMSNEATMAAQTAGGLARARQDREAQLQANQARIQETNRHNMEMEDYQKSRNDEMARANREEAEYRDRMAAVAEQKARAAEVKAAQEQGMWSEADGIKGAKASSQEKAGYNLGAATLETISGFEPLIQGMDDNQFKQVDKVVGPFLSSMLPGGLERMANENINYPDPKVREFLTKGAYIENAFSRAFSGLAVTPFEGKMRERWSPFVTGISQAERITRLKNMAHELEKGMAGFEAQYGRKYRKVAEAMNKVGQDGGTLEGNLDAAITDATDRSEPLLGDKAVPITDLSTDSLKQLLADMEKEDAKWRIPQSR